jgi:hypothetical protein
MLRNLTVMLLIMRNLSALVQIPILLRKMDVKLSKKESSFEMINTVFVWSVIFEKFCIWSEMECRFP